jgi:hypothetical protein
LTLGEWQAVTAADDCVDRLTKALQASIAGWRFDSAPSRRVRKVVGHHASWSHGLTSLMPVPSKSRTFRVASVNPCSNVVAAIIESRKARRSGTLHGGAAHGDFTRERQYAALEGLAH